VSRRGEIVVALHPGAFAGDRLDRYAVPGAEIGAAKTLAGHQYHAADARRGGGAAGFGDAVDGGRGALGGAGQLLELAHRRQRGIEQVEIGQVAREPFRIGEPGEAVLRREPRHRDHALGDHVGETIGAVAGQVVGGDHRLAAADEGAQADIVAFGALGFLDAAVAHVDRLGDAAHGDRVGGVGTVTQRGLDEALGDFRQAGLVEQAGHWQGRSRFLMQRRNNNSVRLRWARRRPRQAESNKFGNTLSSIIRKGPRQRRINQAF